MSLRQREEVQAVLRAVTADRRPYPEVPLGGCRASPARGGKAGPGGDFAGQDDVERIPSAGGLAPVAARPLTARATTRRIVEPSRTAIPVIGPVA